MSDDLLVTVTKALGAYARCPHTLHARDSCRCSLCGTRHVVIGWIRALVTRCEQAEAEVERLQSEVAVMAAGTSHDCDIIADGAETEEQLRADLMGQRDAYGLLLIRCEQAEAEVERLNNEIERQGQMEILVATQHRELTALRQKCEQAEAENARLRGLVRRAMSGLSLDQWYEWIPEAKAALERKA